MLKTNFLTEVIMIPIFNTFNNSLGLRCNIDDVNSNAWIKNLIYYMKSIITPDLAW